MKIATFSVVLSVLTAVISGCTSQNSNEQTPFYFGMWSNDYESTVEAFRHANPKLHPGTLDVGTPQGQQLRFTSIGAEINHRKYLYGETEIQRDKTILHLADSALTLTIRPAPNMPEHILIPELSPQFFGKTGWLSAFSESQAIPFLPRPWNRSGVSAIAPPTTLNGIFLTLSPTPCLGAILTPTQDALAIKISNGSWEAFFYPGRLPDTTLAAVRLTKWPFNNLSAKLLTFTNPDGSVVCSLSGTEEAKNLYAWYQIRTPEPGLLEITPATPERWDFICSDSDGGELLKTIQDNQNGLFRKSDRIYLQQQAEKAQPIRSIPVD